MLKKMMGALAALLLMTQGALAQDWPNGPVKLLIPAKPGGGSDISARIFADYLQKTIGSPVVVINQPTGGGSVAFEEIYNAKPDGQTLVFYHIGIIISSNTGRFNHPMSDFTPIVAAQSYPPQVLATSGDAPWNTLAEFVEDAKANPGKYVMGVTFGSASHFIAGEIMESTGIKLKLVEAASEVDKVAALAGGHINLGNLGAGPAKQYVGAGQLKVLALLTHTANPKYPDFIPVKAQGVGISDWDSPTFVWGPPGMDPALVKKINAAVAGYGDDPEVAARLASADSGFVYRNVEETQALINANDELFGALAEKLDLKK